MQTNPNTYENLIDFPVYLRLISMSSFKTRKIEDIEYNYSHYIHGQLYQNCFRLAKMLIRKEETKVKKQKMQPVLDST